MSDPQRIRFASKGLSLEGELRHPAKGTDTYAVVCHPHPLYGGDMHNAVVAMISRALLSLGSGVLTFNFRGVGGSEGSFDDGAGEADDVRAAIVWAGSQVGVERVLLAGYSFGAGRAAAVVDDAVEALVLVSAPGRSLATPALEAYQGPVLLLSGDADQVSPAEAVHEAAARLPRGEAVIVPGADHFWWGHEDDLVEAIRAFFGAQEG